MLFCDAENGYNYVQVNPATCPDARDGGDRRNLGAKNTGCRTLVLGRAADTLAVERHAAWMASKAATGVRSLQGTAHATQTPTHTHAL